jgi:hypothetical protein
VRRCASVGVFSRPKSGVFCVKTTGVSAVVCEEKRKKKKKKREDAKQFLWLGKK